MSVYLDCNATSPVAPEVQETISTTMKNLWANPSSGYSAGVEAKKCIADARASVARMICADQSDIIFTSGGTESNNMVLHSIARGSSSPVSEATGVTTSSPLPHVITSNIDHDSIRLTAQHLRDAGRIDLTMVSAGSDTGYVSPEEVVSHLRPETRLVCVMLANNETGVLQPVGEIVREIRLWEQRQQSANLGVQGRILVHTDAAQALGKVPVDVRELGVDYLSIAGHKFYGPRMGGLYVRGLEAKTTPLYPLFYGGGQERGYRSGTENTYLIAGLGKAAELVADYVTTYEDHMRSVRDYLEAQLQEAFGERVHFNAKYESSERIPNTCSVSIRGKQFKGVSVMSRLKHCQISTGPACHSTVCRASPVLVACGVPEEVAFNAMRLSVGRNTSKADIDIFISDLKEAIAELEVES